MKKITVFFTWLLLPLVAGALPAPEYKVYYSPDLAGEGLRVELSFRQPFAADSTCIYYADKLWGEEDLFDNLLISEADNPGLRSFRLCPDSNRIILYHAHTKHIRLTYRIRQNHSDGYYTFNRPRVQNTFFHVLGQSLFALPETCMNGDNPQLKIRISWLGFPPDFRIHNSFGSEQQTQDLCLRLWDQFYHSLFVGGDYRIYAFQHHKRPVYFAVRGQWLGAYASDQRLLEALERTIAVQRDFWNDDQFPYYTVFMTPTLSSADSSFRNRSINGSRICNGFMVQSNNNLFNDWEVYSYILNHEMTHDWIGGRIPMRHEELNYWFSEGFTEYYTYKNRLRSGDITPAEWARFFGEQVIWAHWQNPERNRPNYVIRDDFWKSRHIEKIPYRRGALFAFYVDNLILLQSGGVRSLDDLMRDILKLCAEEEKAFNDELFLQMALTYLGRDISYEFQKYIINGEDIPFSDDMLIPDFRVEYEDSVPWIGLRNGKTDMYLK